MTESLHFPGPEPSDPEDVAWTLQTAGTMWARGEIQEAVRWLRRAAEAAGENGNDLRAVDLARAAADLTGTLDSAPAHSPPPLPQSPDQTSRMAAQPVSRPDNPPIQPLDDAAGPFAEADHTIPEGLHAVESLPRRPTPISRRPPPPPRNIAAGSVPGPPLSRPAPPSSTASRPPPSRPAPSRPAPSVRPPSVAPASLVPRTRQALRVAVEPSADDRGLLLVRPLSEDELVPAGAHEAILTALEPGAHLLSRKR
jgi:hypothetical protein